MVLLYKRRGHAPHRSSLRPSPQLQCAHKQNTHPTSPRSRPQTSTPSLFLYPSRQLALTVRLPQKPEWLINSRENPTTAPSSSNHSLCTAYSTHSIDYRVSSNPTSLFTMSELSNLASLARSKLQASVTNKDSSLHRWVLLKNSILQSQPITASVPAVDQSHINREEEYEDDDEEMDSFLFPDADKLFDNSEKDAPVSEAQWLDSLLETLVDEEGDELSVDGQVSALPADEDEDLCLSPLISPMSSSDDLLTQPVYSPPPISVPYPIPYSPVLHTYADDSSFEQPLASRSPPRHDDPVLPYYDIDDLEDLSVPDAIEDTSDDESDLPLTPSLRNSASSLPLQEPPPSSSPPARSRRAHPVVVSADNTYLDPFSLDPLPFAETPFPTYAGVYQDC